MNIGDLKEDVRNIYHSLHLELIWKNKQLRERHWYLENLLNNGSRCKEICGGYIIDLAQQWSVEFGQIPRILDVGCGPVSSLAYLAHERLADVIGVDAIANEYALLLGQYEQESPVRQVQGQGEFLDKVFGDEQFDIVFCRNALDHHQCPGLAWINMFKLTRSGGYLVQSHSIREATKEKWRQLHQFDLFPRDDGSLWIEDGKGHCFALTHGLPLSVTKRAQHRNQDGTGWYTSAYLKLAHGEPSQDLLLHVFTQLKSAFETRSRWAFELEHDLYGSHDMQTPQISADRS